VCRLLAKITGGKLSGADIGSQEIAFAPAKISGGEFSFDIGTAGSCTLLLQAALPVLLSAPEPCSLRIKGGTHVRGAPTYEYFSEVFLPAIRRFGAKCECELVSHGFYPKGGGEIVVRTKPSELSGCKIEKEEGKQARYSIISSSLPESVAAREEKILKETLGKKFELQGIVAPVHSSCAGNALTVWSGTHGGCAIGERGKPAEQVAGEACKDFMSGLEGGAVDCHLADQLLIYAALAKGKTGFSAHEFTSHAKTNAEVLRMMTGRNIILGEEGKLEVF
jgi:RNA 3'-terminal phosphate cyclase (ATP)